ARCRLQSLTDRDGGIRTRDPLNPIQVRYRTALRPVATPPNPTPLPEIDLLLPAARLKWFQAYSEQLRTRLPLSCGLRLSVLQPAFWVRYRTALRPEMLDAKALRCRDAQERLP